MQNVNSYNAQYPIEYYEIGGVYSFYTSDPNLKTVIKDALHPDKDLADSLLEKYKPTLDSLYDEPGIGVDDSPKKLFRFLGVVVDKVDSGNCKYITVLLKEKVNDTDEYYFKKYRTNGKPVFMDGKESAIAYACIGTITKKGTEPTEKKDRKGKGTYPTEKIDGNGKGTEPTRI